MTARRPKVATNSDPYCAIPDRICAEVCQTVCSNIRCAKTVPHRPPIICQIAYSAAIFGVISPRRAKAKLTAGLKCAPDSGPRIVINTTRIAPVAMVLPSKAMATLPPASCSAMMPDPTTVATSIIVPNHSANNRRDRLIISWPHGFAAVAPDCRYLRHSDAAPTAVSGAVRKRHRWP